MALSRRYSRPITVGEDRFKWLFTMPRNQPINGYHFGTVVVELYNDPVSKIEVNVETDVEAWGQPRTKRQVTKGKNMKIIKPKDVAAIIEQALVLGWSPRAKSSTKYYNFENEQLVRRPSSAPIFFD